MPDIIHLLPESIANQIAAGEVVQRPASAIKELMENSIDANATSIKVFVKEAGKTLIQIVDNGLGMSATDARMSLERHATSKIKTADDLFRLRTMGFRGEALASIAAISQFEMKTRPEQNDLGTHLLVEASEVKSQSPASCEKGTNISVKNLFFNIPARRNFLKSNAVEMRHIIEEFQRLALAHPDIAFSLYHDAELIYELAPAKLSQRIVSLFGKSFQGQLAPCQEETTLVKITGYIGRPESARKTRGEQFIFVNQRFIRNNYLNHAVTSAFEGLLMDGSFPFYVLFIEIDPKHIDVNVHPTKTEIKFDDERAIYGVVWAAVKQALGAHNLAPAIDFKADINIESKLGKTLNKEQYMDEQFSTSLHRSNLQNWEKAFEFAAPESKLFQKSESVPTTLRFESSLNIDSSEQAEESGVFQFRQKYIIRSSKTGLMIIDQQAAHERVLFEKYFFRLKNKPGNSQQSLFPQTVTLGASDFALVNEIEHELMALGFRFDLFGNNTFLVTGVPVGVEGSEKELFEGLLEQFKKNQSELQLPIQDSLALALAKRSSVKSGQKLAPEEIKSIVEGLFSCSKPNFSPDGRPTFFTFETSKIESYFTR
jgi:DNA mismatch repair protein MutL